MSGVIRVLCVDDHAFLAEGLRSRIELEVDLEFVGWLPDASNLWREAKERGARVVTVDVDMPGPDPFESIQELHRRCPDVRALMLSAYVRDTYIDAAVQAGAWGYLSKGDDPGHIVEAIRKVAAGKFAVGPSVEERFPLARRAKQSGRTSRSGLLTNREQQILRMIGRGLSRSDIARELHRSSKTVDAHQQSIMRKLDIHDRVELVRYSIREGLVEP